MRLLAPWEGMRKGHRQVWWILRQREIAAREECKAFVPWRTARETVGEPKNQGVRIMEEVDGVETKRKESL